MRLPGVTVRPMRTIDGESHFCEVFLDEVRVPIENRVGAENDGWRVANVTLRFERGTAFVSDVIETRELIHDLVDLAKHLTSRGATRWEDAGLRREVGKPHADV
jgi:alkylation response protein AidB-like acyl-CoA dehydrogenase